MTDEGAAHDDGRVYGMGHDALVDPDWPRLTLAEVNAVLETAGGAAELEWHSARPLSSTARVRLTSGEVVIVKRLPRLLRTPEALAEEHGFMDHLRERGIPVPTTSTVARGDFTYEIQPLGVGADLYQGTFSWSPYLRTEHAAVAGRTLARLHQAARGYLAPRRPPRPLKAGFTVFTSLDPIAAIEDLAAARPALADFLAARDWRGDVERVHLDAHARLLPLLDDLEPLWTHNDWHGTNLLWSGEVPTISVSSVFDFGLADRTVAVHDIATAVERFAVDWISIRDGGPASVQVGQVVWFLRGYFLGRRDFTDAERLALPALFPLVHAEYELSEIDYFLSIVPGGNEKNAEIAYRDYFLGHTEWTKTEEGQALLGLLRDSF